MQMTLEGMRGLARVLGGIPGRKSVIWVTADFPFNLIPDNRAVTDAELAESLPTISQLGLSTRSSGAVANTQRNAHTQEIREAAAQLSSAQVAIYPIDARGLISGMEGGMGDVPARRFQSMLAAFDAACCAAKGVPFRDPRNPSDPELFHEMTLPDGSEMVTIVLLKEACTCTSP